MGPPELYQIGLKAERTNRGWKPLPHLIAISSDFKHAFYYE